MRRWNEIEGQDRAKDILRRALESDRTHHGYLFVGPEGVGKFETALSFARILDCEKREPTTFAEACGTCPSCRKFANDLQHPDLHVVLPQGNVNKFVKIGQVREIQKAATTRPYEARYQIVIIDDVHLMTDEAANALLKTLEEPPDTMHLFLVTDQPQSLLDTIRSRCQTIRFGALPHEVVARILADVVDEAPTVDELTIAAAFGEGSVGRARDLVDSGTLAQRREMFSMLRSLQSSRPAELLSAAEDLAKDRRALPIRLDLLKVIYRDVLLSLVGGQDDRLVNKDLRDDIDAVAGATSVDGVLSRIDAIGIARDLLARNVNATMVAENLLTELAPGTDPRPIRMPKF